MATVRGGNQAALLVIDVQVGVVAEAWESARVVGNIAHVVERARSAGVPVIWVQHEDADLPRGSPEWQWVPELSPAPSEARVHKSFNSAFEQTTLDQDLERLQVTRLVIAGAATNWCIRATAYGALDRGYDVTLVNDAHTTGSMDLATDRRIEARDIVDELNVAMKWLSYPGRKNETAGAAQIDFGASTASTA